MCEQFEYKGIRASRSLLGRRVIKHDADSLDTEYNKVTDILLSAWMCDTWFEDASSPFHEQVGPRWKYAVPVRQDWLETVPGV